MREVVDVVFNGTNDLARWANLGPPAVSNWLADGEFPRGWHYRLHMEAISRGYEIDPILFGEKPKPHSPNRNGKARDENRAA